MTSCFADSSYFIALLNPSDEFHTEAMRISSTLRPMVITTTWVLVEVGNSMSRGHERKVFVAFISAIRRSPSIQVYDAAQDQFDAGLDLYENRLDKDWSATDCISFALMGRLGIRDALTTDRHFQQAGFNALLRV